MWEAAKVVSRTAEEEDEEVDTDLSPSAKQTIPCREHP